MKTHYHIFSELLGEEIIVLTENEHRPVVQREHPQAVIYSPVEIDRMEGLSEASLLQLHKLKKTFDGRVVDGGGQVAKAGGEEVEAGGGGGEPLPRKEG